MNATDICCSRRKVHNPFYASIVMPYMIPKFRCKQKSGAHSYHMTLKPTATAHSTDASSAIQFGDPSCAAAPLEDDEEAALPVADPVAVFGAVGLGVALDVTLLIITSELSVEFVSVVPLINQPSSVL